jgi:DNA-binding MarR family transcriptional regulator
MTLDRKGFLRRWAPQANRRRLEVELTPAGVAALTECNARVDELESWVFRNTNAADQSDFRRTLLTCIESIDRPRPGW